MMSADSPNIIPATKRPDGTWRKEIRVRPGFIRQEDVAKYVAPHQRNVTSLAATTAARTLPSTQSPSNGQSHQHTQQHNHSNRRKKKPSAPNCMNTNNANMTTIVNSSLATESKPPKKEEEDGQTHSCTSSGALINSMNGIHICHSSHSGSSDILSTPAERVDKTCLEEQADRTRKSRRNIEGLRKKIDCLEQEICDKIVLKSALETELRKMEAEQTNREA